MMYIMMYGKTFIVYYLSYRDCLKLRKCSSLKYFQLCLYIYIYRLPHGQYGNGGHILNLPQDVTLITFLNLLLLLML